MNKRFLADETTLRTEPSKRSRKPIAKEARTEAASSRLVEEAKELIGAQIAEFWRCQTLGAISSMSIEALVEMATCTDPAVAGCGTKAIMEIIESLNDSFDEGQSDLYDRTFSKIIDLMRRRSECRRFDEELKSFGLNDEQDLYMRKRRICQTSLARKRFARTKKVVLLSRITMGADVAINSVICRNVELSCADAEIVFLCEKGVARLFEGNQRVRPRSVHYARSGNLADKLNSWLDLLAILRDEIKGLSSEEYLVLDPGSRLSQLGLLPLGDDERYAYFSTFDLSSDTQLTLSKMSAHWSCAVAGGTEFTYPRVWLGRNDLEWTKEVYRALGHRNENPVVAISFGVGGNCSKRISDGFEFELIRTLIESGNKVLLNLGVDPTEVATAESLSQQLRDLGFRSSRLTRRNTESCLLGSESADLIMLDVDPGGLAAAISICDLYIGYDSSGQHIAAALEVPTVTLFVASAGRKHLERWKPNGPGDIAVIAVEPSEIDSAGLLDQTARIAIQMLDKA